MRRSTKYLAILLAVLASGTAAIYSFIVTAKLDGLG
jgi:hypothetical protein